MISILFKILIFVVAVVLVTLLLGSDTMRSKLGLNKENRRIQNAITELAEKIKVLEANVARIQSRQADNEESLKFFSGQFDDLKARVEMLERAASVGTSSDRKENHPQPKAESKLAQPAKITKYVQQLDSDGFAEDALLDNLTKFTKFVVEITGGVAIYEVPTNADCQEKLMNGFASIAPFVEEESHAQAATRIENVTPGTLILEGGFWKVKSKLKIRFV